MSYKPLDHNHPVISSNKIPTINWARDNLVNIRDFLAATGYMPGWNMTMAPGGGTDYTQPSSYTYTNGIQAIKMGFTWNVNKYPNKVSFYYSSDSGENWTPLTDRDGKYVVTCSYDANENCTAEDWGVS